MINNMCPCKDCKQRTITCHSVCREYIDWKSSLNDFNEKVQREKWLLYQTLYKYKK